MALKYQTTASSLCTFNILKTKMNMKQIKYRNFKKADIVQMICDMDLDSINLDSENLDEILSEFKSCISVSVDRHAPEKLSKTPFRDSWPWFNQEMQDLRRSVQNRERIWCKYRQDHQWCAYKEHHDKYTKFLRTSRMLYTQTEITKFKGNSKHSYKLIAEHTGSKIENSLP